MPSSLEHLSLYWHTLKHLRPVQFYGRLWFRLTRPRPVLRQAPPMRTSIGIWQRGAGRAPSMLAPDTFLFLRQEGTLGEVGWDGPQREKLWRYNQHYFDDLNAVGAADRAHWHVGLLQDWVRCNPPGMGNGWEPYPTSLRIVNWVKWQLAGNTLPEACVQSLAVQARWLARRLEFHLLGNHLFANAKALCFAGLFFEGREADRWLRTGLRLLAREVPEQILPDGGHFERSTMYHALALEDMLDLCNLWTWGADALGEPGQRQLAAWQERVAGMLGWLKGMCHPDGEIALFNDAAFGVAPAVAELNAYADRLGLGRTSPEALPRAEAARRVTRFGDSGYVRVEAPEAVALLDVAPVGPDYLPGHAHADTLSFEFSLFGQRLFVNSGTSCYGVSAERLRQRGTAAHSTVTVDGEDSSEVWGGFRVARRARPFDLFVDTPQSGAIEVLCSHDGYRRLPGQVVHTRRWRLGENTLVVEDTVTGAHGWAEARFHINSRVETKIEPNGEEGVFILRTGRAAWRLEGGEARLEPSTYHPRFGSTERNQCLVLRLKHGKARLRLVW